MPKINVKTMVQVALLIALEVVLSRFLSINTAIVKIGFGFVPLALVGLLHGPLWGAFAAAIADFMGAVLFPVGPYFPGFTFTAALVGLTYGLLLHRDGRAMLGRVVAAVAIVCVPLHLGLNTLWIHILYGKGFWALVPTRVLQCVLVAPVQVLVIWFICSRVGLLRRNHA